MATSLTLSLAEELLHQIILYLMPTVREIPKPYPLLLYQHVSTDIISLSMVNHQFRRICFPLLFSYMECKNLETLGKLENECILKSPFTGFIRILYAHVGWRNDEATKAMFQAILVRSLPRLESLVWLDFDATATPALLAAINAHSTLKTAASSIRLSSFPKTPINLERFLLHSGRVEDISEIQRRNIGVACFFLHSDTNCPYPANLDKIIIRDLRELLIKEFRHPSSEIILDEFRAFVAHHPMLTKIHVCRFRSWKDCNFMKPHISTFLDAVECQSRADDKDLNEVFLSPVKSRDFDEWEVTRICLIVESSLVQTLASAVTGFPIISSLSLHLHHLAKTPIHIEEFIALISNLQNLRVFELGDVHDSFVWTPLLEPVLKLDHFARGLWWLGWRIFQSLPNLVKLEVSEEGDDGSGYGDKNARSWYSSASYRAHRDLSGTLVEMEVDTQNMHWVGQDSDPEQQTFTSTYHDFVVF
ncbi:hypothetical protein C8J56DRAFT_1169594 [Mycena floridula]|nr:hypothetical protein C8J56DRAFT_1169594 [Mycena floridula]